MGSINATLEKLEKADFESIKDGLMAMQGWIEAKLDRFYVELQEELVGEPNKAKAVRIPIVSIVRKNRSTFVKDASVDKNAISSCIQEAVGNVICGEWEDVVASILKSTLNVFLGDSRVSCGGQMQEHKSMHVVWADNALLRLDAYVVRFDVSQNSDFQKHAQYFAGHMLLSSVVDFDKVGPEIITYALTRVIRQAETITRKDGTSKYKHTKERILQEIKDVRSVLHGVTEILDCLDEYQEKKHEKELCEEKDVMLTVTQTKYSISDDLLEEIPEQNEDMELQHLQIRKK